MAEVTNEDYVKLISEVFGNDAQKSEQPKVLQQEDILDIFNNQPE